jgi:prepilin peptidase CpaA
MLWIALALLVAGTIFDLRRREIPNWIPLSLCALAVGATMLHVSPRGWSALALGGALGLAIGIAFFALGAFGGGDVKVIAALGALMGPAGLMSLLFYVAIAGGALAAVALVRGRREIAYAPAIALGFAMFTIARGLR